MKCPTGKRQFKYLRDLVVFNKGHGRQCGVYFNHYKCNICNDYHLASRGAKCKPKKLRDTRI